MGKNTDTGHLWAVRVRQMGNPYVREGFSLTPDGAITLAEGNNRRTRRMLKSQMRKGKGKVYVE